MDHTRSLAAAAALFLAPLVGSCGGCSAAAASPGALAQDQEAFIIADPCIYLQADAIHYVNAGDLASLYLTSGSGFYGYRSCPYWIVDVNVASYSTLMTTKELVPRNAFDAASYDAFNLPSSAAYGQTLPANMGDCSRYRLETKLYVQAAGTSAFHQLGTELIAGTHQFGTGLCTLEKISATGAVATTLSLPPLNSGWTTYRFLIAAKLRTSWQEAQLTLFPPAPH